MLHQSFTHVTHANLSFTVRRSGSKRADGNEVLYMKSIFSYKGIWRGGQKAWSKLVGTMYIEVCLVKDLDYVRYSVRKSFGAKQHM